MNFKRGPANCTTETFTRAQRAAGETHATPPFVFADTKGGKRGGRRDEASIIVPLARRLFDSAERMPGRKVLTGNGIPDDRISRTW